MTYHAVEKGTPAELAAFIRQEQDRYVEGVLATGKSSQLQLLAWLWMIHLNRSVETLHVWTRTQPGWMTYGEEMLRQLGTAVDDMGALSLWRAAVGKRLKTFVAGPEVVFAPPPARFSWRPELPVVEPPPVVEGPASAGDETVDGGDEAPEDEAVEGVLPPTRLTLGLNSRGDLEPMPGGGAGSVEFIIRWRLWFEASRFSLTDIKSARRTADLVAVRQEAMLLAKQLTLKSLPEIGRIFGGRDHTTVLHAVRKYERMCEEDAALRARTESMCERLRELLDDHKRRVRMARAAAEERERKLSEAAA